MAIAVCSVKIIGRSHGKCRSMVAAAAYRAGVKLHDDSRGKTHDYTRKTGVVYSEILVPEGAPSWASNRQQLCNLIEQTERRKDSQLAREIMIALPQELTLDQNIALARAYAQKFVRQGMIADVSIHDSGDGNPHAHILFTLRPIAGNGFGKKCREWNSDAQMMAWRKCYEDVTNQHLKMAGHDVRIDVRSYEAQGIDRIPGVHMGPYAHRLEQQGFYSELGARNREIVEQNRQLDEIAVEIEEAYKERDELIREIAQEEEPEHILSENKRRNFDIEKEHILSERESKRRDFDIEQVYAEEISEQAQPQTPELEPLPESGPPSSEPKILRQRKLAQEQQQEKEAGSRSPPLPHSPLHSGGRTLAQQRQAAQERQGQQKPEEGTLRHTPSPGHSGGRILARQREAAKERQGQEQQKAEGQKTQQKTQQLHRNHGSENLSHQRKIALKHKKKGQVSQAYEKPQHHERGDDVRRLAPDEKKEPHHEAEGGRVHTKRRDKMP